MNIEGKADRLLKKSICFVVVVAAEAAYKKSTPHSSLPDLTGASHMELFEQP